MWWQQIRQIQEWRAGPQTRPPPSDQSVLYIIATACLSLPGVKAILPDMMLVTTLAPADLAGCTYHLLPLHQAVSPCRLVQLLALGALVASFLLNGVAGYGCVELQSIVLQQAFLAVPISQVRPVQRCVVR